MSHLSLVCPPIIAIIIHCCCFYFVPLFSFVFSPNRSFIHHPRDRVSDCPFVFAFIKIHSMYQSSISHAHFWTRNPPAVSPHRLFGSPFVLLFRRQLIASTLLRKIHCFRIQISFIASPLQKKIVAFWLKITHNLHKMIPLQHLGTPIHRLFLAKLCDHHLNIIHLMRPTPVHPEFP